MKTYSMSPPKKAVQKGVTLIELIITVSILAIITVTCATFMSASANMIAANEKMMQDERNIRQALLTITRELHKLKQNQVVDPDTEEVKLRAVANRLSLGNGTVYELDEGVLKLNDAEFVSGIEVFTPAFDGKYVTIDIKGRYGMLLTTKIKVLRGS